MREVPEPWAGESLLTVLREWLGLVGAKEGCGAGDCGACVVHVAGRPRRACLVPARAVAGEAILTIEGLAGPDGALHPLQAAWIAEGVAQCGFCQAGHVMQAAALLAANPDPDPSAITAALGRMLCRCGTQPRMHRAIRRAATALRAGEVP
ncbi:(2Fe-2S)-binding protein [Roseomonas sp. BU-1]|uniref:(2Fe-2S)-binding protein n=2 Tax=Falsiroseomonas selenitidurans TaxID=2716335 RepID=A0ABX1E4P6_9PROT|nr:(2Fe-2S)-binding protein [Falsiroseomonas selenitidurans]